MAFGITAPILFATVSASANVTLPALLADHMVVQRGLPVRVWGMAAPHESVAVTFRGETKSATADDLGRWSVSLSPGEALRLALAARAIAYGEKIEWSGHHISPGHAAEHAPRVWFDHASGLFAKGAEVPTVAGSATANAATASPANTAPAVTSFEIASADAKYPPAEAKIEGESVVVSNPAAPAPVSTLRIGCEPQLQSLQIVKVFRRLLPFEHRNKVLGMRCAETKWRIRLRFW
jgi:hypothetical protein